jgi:uncharacterized lipoprotein YbaY
VKFIARPLRFAPVLLAAGFALAGAGCDHLDLGHVEGDPNHTVSGTVHVRGDAALPADAKAVVRVVDPSNPTLPPQVLGEQEIDHPGQPPIAFQVAYKATDEQLLHGLNVEARISYGGSVRFYTLSQVSFNSGNQSDPQVVWVDPVQR